MTTTPVRALRELARLYDVQAFFYDVDGRRTNASAEGLLATLRALGAPLDDIGDAPAALRERQQVRWQQVLEPAVVVSDGQPAEIELRVPAARAEEPIEYQVTTEDGEERRWTTSLGFLPSLRSEDVEGIYYEAKRLKLPPGLPRGYHQLSVTLAGQRYESLIVSAPKRAYQGDGRGREWGLFAPLYGLQSAASWGAGDFSGLRAIMGWTGQLGGRLVATLPLLAAYLDEPFEPSPYVPASRLFWNEFFVDVRSIPELVSCANARAKIGSSETVRELARLRSDELVDYKGVMSLKRGVLEDLARCFFSKQPSSRRSAFEDFVRKRPQVEDYARFRAAGERLRAPWGDWPEPLRGGTLGLGDYDQQAERYHLYVQWVAQEQLEALAVDGRARGVRLHLDLPLGTHPAGYDVWRERSLFAGGGSAGAPPDTFFPGGQNWGFPVVKPEAERTSGFRHFIAVLRHHLEPAGSLRIDHVMGLHRRYFIPSGMSAQEGVYLRYPADDLYAILRLESHRNRTVIVGEDLGTVPRAVRAAMSKHGLQRSYVLQIDSTVSKERPFGRIPRSSVASLNTHDTPPFAAFWSGADVEERMKLGVLPKSAAAEEARDRRRWRAWLITFLKRQGLLPRGRADDTALLRACLGYLGASRATTLLVNIEDLWLETESQNVPGTTDEHPNWRRKLDLTLEELRDMPEVIETLTHVDRMRGTRVRNGNEA